MIGTIYFVGYIGGSIYFPRLADIYGRKPFVIVGGFIQSIWAFFLLYSNNFTLIYINMFLIGIASPFLASIGYNYVIELIPESMENPVNTLIMWWDACGSLIGILYFTYFSSKINTFFGIIAVLGVLASICHILTPESPIFLSQEDAERISDVEVHSPVSSASRKHTSMWDLVTNKTLFTNTLVMVSMWCTTSAGYYLINFNMKYIGGTIIHNIVASVSSEIFASILASIIFWYLGPKKSLTMFFSISAVAGAVFWIGFNSPMVITVLILIAKFGISAAYWLIYIVTAKIFPAMYAATVFGICNIFARIVTALTPMIIELPTPYPMLFLSITWVLVWFSTQFMNFKYKHFST